METEKSWGWVLDCLGSLVERVSAKKALLVKKRRRRKRRSDGKNASELLMVKGVSIYECEDDRWLHGVPLPDTVRLRGGSPVLWLFQSTAGKLEAQPQGMCNLEKVKTFFEKTSVESLVSSIVVVRERAGVRRMLSTSSFATLSEATSAESIQGSIQGKQVSPLGVSHEIRFKSSREMPQSFACFCLEAPAALDAEGNLQRKAIRSHDLEANREMHESVVNLVRAIEVSAKCKVSAICCEFLQAVDNRMWLVGAKEIHTIPNSDNSARLFRTPTRFKPPSHFENRIKSKALAEAEPEDELGPTEFSNAVLGKTGATKQVLTKKKQISQVAWGETSSNSCRKLSIRESDSFDASFVTEERLRVKQNARLSSSQSTQCPGDFCTIAVDLTNLGSDSTGIEAHEDLKVHYKSIVEARMEKEFVTLLIKRILRNEEGDYFQSSFPLVDAKEDNVAKSNPAHYYEEVKVCQNCSRLYGKIAAERSFSLQRRKRRIESLQVTTPPEEEILSQPNFPSERVHPFSEEGRRLMQLSLDQLRQLAISRTRKVASEITKPDLAELRSYQTPPGPVLHVVKALMYLLTGKMVQWEASKRIISNGERFMAMVNEFHPENFEHSITELDWFFNDREMSPHLLQEVSKTASAFSTFVLGSIAAIKYKAGMLHPRNDPLLFLEKDACIEQKKTDESNVDEGSLLVKLPEYLRKQQQQQKGKHVMAKQQRYRSSANLQDKRELNLGDLAVQKYDDGKGPIIKSPSGFSQVQHVVFSGTQVAFNRNESKKPRPHFEVRGKAKESQSSIFDWVNHDKAIKEMRDHLNILEEEIRPISKREARARAKMQQRQMHRLHSGSENLEGNDDSEGATTAVKQKSFVCSDRKTTLVYDISGKADLEAPAPNVVVINDFFDTFEAAQILLEPIVKKHLGSQVLVFNYPGQAYTRFSSALLNNEFLASTLHELLAHLDNEGEFCCSARDFVILGIGNGANIGMFFVKEFGNSELYQGRLRSIVSVNGFVSVDEGLAGILHNSVNVFSCFPPNRPDLPVSYFSRYLFSEEYLARVDPNLALNLFTAVANPITLEGRIQICKGALHHKEMQQDLRNMEIPLILVKGTKDSLIGGSSVDQITLGRNVTQVRSSNEKLENLNENIIHALKTRRGTAVIWIDGGHEIKQECKPEILETIDIVLHNFATKNFPRVNLPVANREPKEEKRKRQETKDEDEFEIAMRKHTETKRNAAKARRQRLEEIEEKARLEEKKVRERGEKQRFEAKRREAEEELRREIEEKRRLEEERMRREFEEKQQQMLDELEEERTRAFKLAEELAREAKEGFEIEQAAENLTRLKTQQEKRQAEWNAEERAQIVALEKKLCPGKNFREVEVETKTTAEAEAETNPGNLIETVIQDVEDMNRSFTENTHISSSEYHQVRAELEKVEQKRLNEEERNHENEFEILCNSMACNIQRVFRGRQSRLRVKIMCEERILEETRWEAAVKIQALARGYAGRLHADEILKRVLQDRVELEARLLLQRCGRGMLGRKLARMVRENLAAVEIQRVVRGNLKANEATKLREIRQQDLAKKQATIKIQSLWRMHKGRELYLHRRILELAAVQVQRVYRGCRGRRRALRKRTWMDAEPGPERLKLGISLIEESKAAFHSQQEELEALHRAQEKAETKVGKVHSVLIESEKELAILEQELRDVDELDNALQQLAHEKALHDTQLDLEREKVESYVEKKLAEESYALEVQIHLKRAERERKKKELDAEFAAVHKDIEDKKLELSRLQDSIEDMESTRERKEREFQRLQRNLMELLEEQKIELDSLREKGVELEVATSHSAAAAAATAAAAKENEERSKEMFSNTEELLKFQFMSMSLSYFSSMNMLRNLRDINSDTTQSAISSSAKTAAAAAAAAEAANIPDVSAFALGKQSLIPQDLKMAKPKQKENIDLRKEAKDSLATLKDSFPGDVRKWTVQDVGRWLDMLSLGMHKAAFEEACIDGEFLLELRQEDMRDILGMTHALHVQKVDLARNKLRPLDDLERAKRDAVLWEQERAAERNSVDNSQVEEIPDVQTVFSQIRNGRFKKVEKALDAGFFVDETDSHGNTPLIVACQNLNRKICELLIKRGANVNHQNSQGQTAMHYAMAYDPEGSLGEFLITSGADDSVENKLGLSPYDGIE